jgi:hypothetical protein
MGNNHGGLQLRLVFTDFIYTMDASFERSFLDFKASISYRHLEGCIPTNFKELHKIFGNSVLLDGLHG